MLAQQRRQRLHVRDYQPTRKRIEVEQHDRDDSPSRLGYDLHPDELVACWA